MDFGAVPDWISSVATVGALLAAIYAGRVARKLYQRESDRDQLAQRDRSTQALLAKRSQAERVVAWIGDASAPLSAPDGRRIGVIQGRVVSVLNQSGRPVWDVSVVVAGNFDGEAFEGAINIPLLPPSDEAFTSLPADVLTLPDDAAVTLRFRDAANAVWMREPDGSLVLLHKSRAVDLGHKALP